MSDRTATAVEKCRQAANDMLHTMDTCPPDRLGAVLSEFAAMPADLHRAMCVVLRYDNYTAGRLL